MKISGSGWTLLSTVQTPALLPEARVVADAVGRPCSVVASQLTPACVSVVQASLASCVCVCVCGVCVCVCACVCAHECVCVCVSVCVCVCVGCLCAWCMCVGCSWAWCVCSVCWCMT